MAGSRRGQPQRLTGSGGSEGNEQKSKSFTPLLQESMLTFCTELYMKVLKLELELLHPETPSNSRPNRRVCASAARVRVGRLPRSCTPRRSESPPRSRKKASKGRSCRRRGHQGGIDLGPGS